MLMTFEQDEFDGAHRKVLMKYPRIVYFSRWFNFTYLRYGSLLYTVLRTNISEFLKVKSRYFPKL